MFKKVLKFMFLTLMAYLLQACVAQRIAIGGVAPNPAMALAAIVSVALGWQYTLILSLTVGYLLEIMLPTINYFSMVAYPVCCVLGVLFFGDKSERKLEENRTRGKTSRQLPAHLRTVLCALLSIVVFEFVNLVYTYLTGVPLKQLAYGRAIIDIVYTVVLAGVLQFPIRWWLGIYKLAKAR